jgi:hypothetical protein
MKFYENSTSRNRSDPCGPGDRRTDMTKLIAAFRSFAKVPKSGEGHESLCEQVTYALSFEV